MPLAKDMTNQQKQDFPVDAVLNGGPSMNRGESLQTQIEKAPTRALTAPLITGWRNAAGKEYSTSIAQQLAYNAQGIARIEARQAVQQELLQQVVNSLSKGVALQIDYARIEAAIKASMPEAPEYELTKKESK